MFGNVKTENQHGSQEHVEEVAPELQAADEQTGESPTDSVRSEHEVRIIYPPTTENEDSKRLNPEAENSSGEAEAPRKIKIMGYLREVFNIKSDHQLDSDVNGYIKKLYAEKEDEGEASKTVERNSIMGYLREYFDGNNNDDSSDKPEIQKIRVMGYLRDLFAENKTETKNTNMESILDKIKIMGYLNDLFITGTQEDNHKDIILTSKRSGVAEDRKNINFAGYLNDWFKPDQKTSEQEVGPEDVKKIKVMGYLNELFGAKGDSSDTGNISGQEIDNAPEKIKVVAYFRELFGGSSAPKREDHEEPFNERGKQKDSSEIAKDIEISSKIDVIGYKDGLFNGKTEDTDVSEPDDFDHEAESFEEDNPLDNPEVASVLEKITDDNEVVDQSETSKFKNYLERLFKSDVAYINIVEDKTFTESGEESLLKSEINIGESQDPDAIKPQPDVQNYEDEPTEVKFRNEKETLNNESNILNVIDKPPLETPPFQPTGLISCANNIAKIFTSKKYVTSKTIDVFDGFIIESTLVGDDDSSDEEVFEEALADLESCYDEEYSLHDEGDTTDIMPPNQNLFENTTTEATPPLKKGSLLYKLYNSGYKYIFPQYIEDLLSSPSPENTFADGNEDQDKYKSLLLKCQQFLVPPDAKTNNTLFTSNDQQQDSADEAAACGTDTTITLIENLKNEEVFEDAQEFVSSPSEREVDITGTLVDEKPDREMLDEKAESTTGGALPVESTTSEVLPVESKEGSLTKMSKSEIRFLVRANDSSQGFVINGSEEDSPNFQNDLFNPEAEVKFEAPPDVAVVQQQEAPLQLEPYPEVLHMGEVKVSEGKCVSDASKAKMSRARTYDIIQGTQMNFYTSKLKDEKNYKNFLVASAEEKSKISLEKCNNFDNDVADLRSGFDSNLSKYFPHYIEDRANDECTQINLERHSCEASLVTILEETNQELSSRMKLCDSVIQLHESRTDKASADETKSEIRFLVGDGQPLMYRQDAYEGEQNSQSSDVSLNTSMNTATEGKNDQEIEDTMMENLFDNNELRVHKNTS